MAYAALDKVLFVPSGRHPNKTSEGADAEQRYQMTVAAIGSNKRYVPSRVETDKPGISYTADTLTLIQNQYFGSALFLILGDDKLPSLDGWYHRDSVISQCTFLIVPRQNPPLDLPAVLSGASLTGARMEAVPMKLHDVSGCVIRQSLKRGVMPDGIPTAVQAYIALSGLYGYAPLIANAAPILTQLCQALPPRRFAHSLNVCYTAAELADIHGVDKQKAVLAALLHDCAKAFPEETMRSILQARGMRNGQAPESNATMHGPAGSVVAQEAYGIHDPDILKAIRVHTLGEPRMSALDMVVFIADTTEPGRVLHNRLEELRSLSRTNLPAAIALSLTLTAQRLKANGAQIHPSLYKTIQWIENTK